MSDALKRIFGVPKMPAVRGLEPVHDDYTAGFANGVEAAVEWLRAIPNIEMPTSEPDVISLHDMSAKEAACHLEEAFQRIRSGK